MFTADTPEPEANLEDVISDEELEEHPRDQLIVFQGEIGRLLFKLRDAKEITREQLTERTGIDEETINEIEHGNIRNWEEAILLFITIGEQNKFLEIMNSFLEDLDGQDQQNLEFA